ncbi:MAG: Mur ligase family protein [Bacteroidales bacterium]|nr:Mur ligase family protein [Bacteroidales bacterium]
MRIHFIAVGGSAMHNLAIALKQAGHSVTGSDDEIFEPSKSRLRDFGLLPESFGWHPDFITNELDVIILGMHARAENPELIQAQQIGVPVLSYPEFLAQHAMLKQRIVIGGSHGKTTITSMVMHVMKHLNFDFDYLVGSKIKHFDVMVRLNNDAPVVIFEGDEYLSSPIDLRPKFHWYKPHIALISGIAWDHMNVFPTFENYLEQFDIFIQGIEPGGLLIYDQNDENLVQLVKKNSSVESIGYDVHPHVVKDGVTWLQTEEGLVAIGLFGRHNLQNLNGARLICKHSGISDHDFYQAIGSFEGAANRLEKVFDDHHLVYFKDFAHAPSKVRATLLAVRNQFPDRKLVTCFELHTYSSLNINFLSEYLHALDPADLACVYFNLHALALKKLPMLNKQEVKEAFGRDDMVVFNQSEDVINWIRQVKDENKVILMMSSGNFDGINHLELAKSLK